jgi:hypothetical protein
MVFKKGKIMRCYNCKASCTVHYSESYETDWYCNAGVSEDEMNEDRNGELGCNLKAKTIQQRIDFNERAWLKDKADFVNWMQKHGNI